MEKDLYGFYRRNILLNHEGKGPLRLDQKLHQPKKKSRINRFWNWKPENDTLGLQLLREWSIHGIKYIAQPNRHIFERFFWLVTVLTSTGIAIFLSWKIVKKYNDSPVIVSFQSSQTSVSQVPFPAITICNVNLFKKSAFKMALSVVEAGPEANGFVGYNDAEALLRQMEHVCDTSKSFSTKFNFSIDETTTNLKGRGIKFRGDLSDRGFTVKETYKQRGDGIKLSVQHCEDMLRLCLWEGEAIECKAEFMPILTDFGMCCTFNMMPRELLLKLPDNTTLTQEEIDISPEILKEWDSFNLDSHVIDKREKLPEHPRHQAKAGKSSGLSILLYPDIPEYFCTIQDGYGFRIYPHSPIEFPHVLDFGMAIQPNTEMFVNLQAEVTVAEDINSLSIEKRSCYFLPESPLKHFDYYTSTNCIDECVMLRTKARCGCILYDMPIRFGPEHINLTFCEQKNFTCAMKEKEKIGREGTKTACKHCYPSCNRILYDTKTSSFPIRNDVNIWMHEFNELKRNESSEDDYDDNENGKETRKQGQKMMDWKGKNVSIVHLYFGSDTVYTRVRKRLYSFNELFASVGGILGLFIGFSLISLVEPFYFVYRVLMNRSENQEDDDPDN